MTETLGLQEVSASLVQAGSLFPYGACSTFSTSISHRARLTTAFRTASLRAV